MRSYLKNFISSFNYVSILYVFLWSFCIASRFASLGNPLIDVDEGFYLFVGGQILQGAVPFVDIWDRKPLGLFLLYSFFHLFGPYRILAYQIGATLCVGFTSMIVMKMAMAISSPFGAFLAALLYISCLNIAGGEGGQSPVFYNLLVAFSMYLIFKNVVEKKGRQPDIQKTAYAVMLIMGISIQIKYTTLFEGIFSGLFLLFALYQKTKSIRFLSLQAVIWICIACSPTIGVAVVYMMAGHGQEWWFANIASIFHRGQRNHALVRHQAAKMLEFTLPLLVSIPFRRIFCLDMTKQQKLCGRFFDLWTFSALSGVAVFGSWYTHYALPLFTPLTIVSAAYWNRSAGKIWMLLLLGYMTFKGQTTIIKHQNSRGNKIIFQNILSNMSKNKGCLFIYSGSPIFYDFANFCKMTTHPFPGHFHEYIERSSTGMDPLIEIQHILNQKPMYILSREPAIEGENMQVRQLLYQSLSSYYYPAYRVALRDNSIVVYKLTGSPK